MKILGSLFLCAICFTGSASEGDVAPEKTPIDELKDLSTEMSSMTEKLREDRTDPLVQTQGKQIEDKLETMTKAMEEKQQQQEKKNKQSQNQKQPQQDAKSPLEKSVLKEGKPPPHSQEPPPEDSAKVAGQDAKWAKLPPAMRDELLQTFREEVPVKWRDRISAYFESIAAEEAKKKDN